MYRILLVTLLIFYGCLDPKGSNNAPSTSNDEIGIESELLPPGVPTFGLITKNTNSATIPFYAPNNGGPVQSYDLIYSTYPSLNNGTTISDIPNPFFLNDLDSNTIYYIMIIAKNASGESQSVKSSFRTDMQGPSRPVITNFTDVTKNSAKVHWEESLVRMEDEIPVNGASRGAANSGGNNGGSGDDPNEISLSSFTTTLHPVMLNRCASCHNIEQYGTSAHGATDAQVAHDAMFFIDTQNRKKVDLEIPTNSRLYTKVMEGHQCGATCASEILQAINDWIVGGATEPVEPPPPPPDPIPVNYTFQYSESSNFVNAVTINDPENPIELTGLERSTKYYVRMIATNPVASTVSRTKNFTTVTPPFGGGPIDYKVRLRVGDRRYIESVLKDVFNVTSSAQDPNDVIRLEIFENPAFGGGCDRYSGKIISGNTIEHTRERCFGGMGVSDTVTFNPMRAAAVSKACDALINNSATFNNAYNKISSSGTPSINNDEHLTNAYRLFYPQEDLSAEMKTALRDIAAQTSNNTQKWKYVLLGICVTPEWQTLY